MPKIEFSSKADSDVGSLHAHYEEILGAVKAKEILGFVLDAIENLADFPHMGKATDHPDCRVLILSKYPYRVTYTVIGGTVLVYRVLHQHANEGAG